MQNCRAMNLPNCGCLLIITVLKLVGPVSRKLEDLVLSGSRQDGLGHSEFDLGTNTAVGSTRRTPEANVFTI